MQFTADAMSHELTYDTISKAFGIRLYCMGNIGYAVSNPCKLDTLIEALSRHIHKPPGVFRNLADCKRRGTITVEALKKGADIDFHQITLVNHAIARNTVVTSSFTLTQALPGKPPISQKGRRRAHRK